MSALTTLIQHNAVHSIQCNKARKGIQSKKEEIKLSLFADDMITYMENPEESKNKNKKTNKKKGT